MSLSVSYREYILEKLLLEYFKDGDIPTPDQLESDLATYQLTHPNLSLPKSKYMDFSVEHGSTSSAAMIDSIIDTVSADIIASTKEVYKIAKQNSIYYERWQNELDRLSSKANRLQDRIDSLLLLANNTEGYFATIEDYLYDMTYIDMNNTTAKVNSSEQKVILNSDSSLGSVTQYNTDTLTLDDIAFYSLNRDVSNTYYNTSRDNSLLRIFKSDSSSWVGKVVANKSGPMTTELKIHLSKTNSLEVSKISLKVYSNNTSSQSTITAQYSVDGYNWFIVPCANATQSFKGEISWSFNPSNMNWVKFIIYKPSHDSGQYEYIYSISSIKFFNNKYFSEAGDTFITTALSAEDIDKNKIGFFKAQLNTCELIPNNTSILYYLSASKDDSTWTSWYPIYPFSNKDTSLPKIVNFSGISIKDNSDSSTDLLNSNYEAQELTPNFTDTDVNYRFYSSEIVAVNTKITIDDEIDKNIVSNTIEVWRNLVVLDDYPDTLKVRDVPRGWHLDGQTYSCYFKIVSASGRTIDFGNRLCVVDGKEMKGIVNIPSGIHKFETVAENWYDISSLINNSISEEEVLKIVDPLYPYNHKLLIEGVSYSSNFNGTKIYLGMDTVAEYYCKRASLFDLQNNTSGLDTFAIKDIGITDQILAIFLLYDSKNTDYVNEKVLVSWKANDSETETYKYIKLKVELSSESEDITPEFTGYRIKLGA